MSDADLDPAQLDRYSRHVIMEDVGPAGQARLLEGSVLCIGAGGLGAPIIQYLAAAGVGTLGIADDDVVERSNLQRQVIHTESDRGRPKVESAREFVAARNPDVDVDVYQERVTADTIQSLLADYDFVVDASDNFETLYLVNDACALEGIPFSYGSVLRFEGQASTFLPDGHSPCYRCLFPEAPPADSVPDCATAGVLGVLPGVIGSLQATEAIKYLLGTGELLDGRLTVYDALEMTFEEVTVRDDPDCPVCGDDPDIETVEAIDYDGRCSVQAG